LRYKCDSKVDFEGFMDIIGKEEENPIISKSNTLFDLKNAMKCFD